MATGQGSDGSKRLTGKRKKTEIVEDPEDIEEETVPPLTRKRSKQPPAVPSSSTNLSLVEVPSPIFCGEGFTVSQKLQVIREVMTDLMPSGDSLGSDLTKRVVSDFSRAFASTAFLATKYDNSARKEVEAFQAQLGEFHLKDQKQRDRITALEKEVRTLISAKFPGKTGELRKEIAELKASAGKDDELRKENEELKVMNASLESRISDLKNELARCKEEKEMVEVQQASVQDFVEAQEERHKALLDEALSQVDDSVKKGKARAAVTVIDKLNARYEERFEKFREFFKIFKDLREVDLLKGQAVGTIECLEMLSRDHGVCVPEKVMEGLKKGADDLTAQYSELKGKLPTIDPSELEIIRVLPERTASAAGSSELLKISFVSAQNEIKKDKNAEPIECEEQVAQALFDLENTNQELKK